MKLVQRAHRKFIKYVRGTLNYAFGHIRAFCPILKVREVLTMKLIQGDYRKINEYLRDVLSGAYFEFNFPYVDEKNVFKEINRFNDESRKLTRFKNKYLGDVVVNISDWVDKPINEYFRAFMYFLLDRKLDSKNAVLLFACEKICSYELLVYLEEHFEEKIQTVDLGVNTRNTSQQTIGFIVEDSTKREGADRNV